MYWASTLMTSRDVHSEHLMLWKRESPAVDSHRPTRQNLDWELEPVGEEAFKFEAPVSLEH